MDMDTMITQNEYNRLVTPNAKSITLHLTEEEYRELLIACAEYDKLVGDNVTPILKKSKVVGFEVYTDAPTQLYTPYGI